MWHKFSEIFANKENKAITRESRVMRIAAQRCQLRAQIPPS